MLIEATKEIIEELKERLYALALDPTKSGYPLFSDGTKTKQDFFEYIEQCANRENDTSLLYLEDGAVLGLMQYFTIPQDNYLQLCGCYISQNTEAALTELLLYLAARYQGYELYFGFSDKNEEACFALKNMGFSLIEDDNHDIMIFAEYKPMPCSESIRKIHVDSFGDFRKLHQADDTMYWNSDRIWKNFSQWNIYAYYEHGEAVAAIFETCGEIFGFDFKDNIFREDVFKNLVVKVLNELKSSGQKDMTFFNEDESQQAVLELGFRCVGRYQLYHKVLA